MGKGLDSECIQAVRLVEGGEDLVSQGTDGVCRNMRTEQQEKWTTYGAKTGMMMRIYGCEINRRFRRLSLTSASWIVRAYEGETTRECMRVRLE